MQIVWALLHAVNLLSVCLLLVGPAHAKKDGGQRVCQIQTILFDIIQALAEELCRYMLEEEVDSMFVQACIHPRQGKRMWSRSCIIDSTS